jgi:ATP-dependent RNA helicase DDX21
MCAWQQADQMLDLGFKDEIEKLFNAMPASKGGGGGGGGGGRQTLMFSATMPAWIDQVTRSS